MSKATWDTLFGRREADEIEQQKMDAGYKFLGWQLGSGAEYENCIAKGHAKDRTLKSEQHNSRGSNVTYWCDDCKIVYKIDMSD